MEMRRRRGRGGFGGYGLYRRRRRGKKIGLVLGVVFGLLLLIAVLLFSVRITEIEVSGNQHYTKEQIIDLIANGVNAIHVYTMNKPDVAAKLRENLSDRPGENQPGKLCAAPRLFRWLSQASAYAPPFFWPRALR